MEGGSSSSPRPQSGQKYKKYHAAVWPALLEMIQACNIRNDLIAFRDRTLFSDFECRGMDFAAWRA